MRRCGEVKNLIRYARSYVILSWRVKGTRTVKMKVAFVMILDCDRSFRETL